MRYLHGKRIRIIAMGCRTNLYEAEAVGALLEARGACLAEGPGCDAAVVMSCAVTGAASAKTRKIVRRLRRELPRSVIAICGCWSQLASEDDAREIGADIVLGSRKKHEIADALERAFAGKAGSIYRSVADVSRDGSWDSLALDRPRAHTRAFIKVQDGCSRSCSYCVIPIARGASVSRDPDDAIAEIERVAEAGCREVILTGVHLGSYAHGELGLAHLIERISTVDGLTRLRLGSIEPFSLSADVLCALRDSPIFCPYLHIPLQSGADRVLALMRRGMTTAGYADVVRSARTFLGDDLHVGTDIIIGFPGETEEEFARGLDLLRSVGIGRVHVFPYSPREGTDAASFDDSISDAEMGDRVSRALEAADEMLQLYASRFVGRECEILEEEREGGSVFGWTRNYLRAGISTDIYNKGNESRIVPKSSVGGILFGERA